MTYRILVVDDSKLARMAVAKLMNACQPDWTRLEAGNAVEAMALAQKERIDVALLDFNMPGRDGLELAAELRATKPELPIALLSANHQQEIVARARHLGVTFLSKPLTEDALKAFLTKASQRVAAAS